MTKGFDNEFVDKVEFDIPQKEIDKLLKKYKKINKYRKSSLFAIKSMDGTEDIIAKMIEESEEAGF